MSECKCGAQEPIFVKEPVYLQARVDAVQDMFDELEFVSIDMIASVLGVSMSKYKAKQKEIMKGHLENDLD